MSVGLFSAQYRLQTKAEFSAVFERAQKRHGRFFTLFFRPNLGERPRLGVAVAKRFFKRAHDRNLYKRLVRENFRINKALLNGLDVVVVVKKEADTCTNQEFSMALQKAWQP